MLMRRVQLSIQKPCHEEWNNMTPTQKGAFCGSCQKEVQDFSETSLEEAASYIINNPGTCAKLPSHFLQKPVLLISRKRRIQFSFFICILLFFGTLLTSCSNDQQATPPTVEPTQKTTPAPIQEIQQQLIDTIERVQAPTSIEPKEMCTTTTGEVAEMPEFLVGDTVAPLDTLKISSEINSPDTSIMYNSHVFGGVGFSVVIDETKSTTSEPTFEYTPNLFPNPTTSNFQINMDIQEGDDILIEIYNLNGQLLEHRPIVSESLVIQEQFTIKIAESTLLPLS